MAKRIAPKKESSDGGESRLRPETKKSIWGIAFLGLALIFILAGVDKAGPLGNFIFNVLDTLLGWGYFVLPFALLVTAIVFFISKENKIVGLTSLGGGLFVLSFLGLIHIFAPGHGGWLGLIFGSLQVPLGDTAAALIVFLVLITSALIALNVPLRLPRMKKREEEKTEPEIIVPEAKEPLRAVESKAEDKEEDKIVEKTFKMPVLKKTRSIPQFKNYVPPPLDLLRSSNEKPTTGDLRANANVIKRTLESFGIPVEMGEINVGPKVTRYTLKPAEGVKLSRITALNQDLALALAAHPIRIEAPIPGKSLVGIEVPNKAAALVRLGSLMSYPDFAASGPLGFVLGRDVTGEPHYANIEKMPHLLIAGSTGSGKSVMIHSLITSLLYKNSPATLRLVLIDPKRVELTIYEGIPHLISSVVTDAKKSVGVFKWAISEMERRYDLLQAAGSRDITSYNKNGGKDNPLPYLVVVVDELADLMTSYGREIEGSIVRLAQMARATGLHLILSTQRPSVEVITGLIKANITSRIALQVASQVDSRTILDTSGAEKLLGGGDLLFVSSELSKPKRIQGAYLGEEEIKAVADFIKDHNDISGEEVIVANFENGKGSEDGVFSDFADDDDDELYHEAVRVVREARKASASLLQRRLKVGYARAARLLDLMEEHGIIGPGEGAKPRDVYLESIAEEN